MEVIPEALAQALAAAMPAMTPGKQARERGGWYMGGRWDER